jgi:hypothetical protein
MELGMRTPPEPSPGKWKRLKLYDNEASSNIIIQKSNG